MSIYFSLIKPSLPHMEQVWDDQSMVQNWDWYECTLGFRKMVQYHVTLSAPFHIIFHCGVYLTHRGRAQLFEELNTI